MNQPTNPTKADLIDLAKQGHPRAIAALINQVTRPQGVQVRSGYAQGCLQLWFQAEVAPDRDRWVPFIYQGLKKLNPVGIHTVQMIGQLSLTHEVVWREQLSLAIPSWQPSDQDPIPDPLISLASSGNRDSRPTAPLNLAVSEQAAPTLASSQRSPHPNSHHGNASTAAVLQASSIPFNVKRSLRSRPERRALRLASRKQFLSNILAGLLVCLIGLPLIVGALLLLEQL